MHSNLGKNVYYQYMLRKGKVFNCKKKEKMFLIYCYYKGLNNTGQLVSPHTFSPYQIWQKSLDTQLLQLDMTCLPAKHGELVCWNAGIPYKKQCR